jgi:hypothetical protein
MIQREEVQVNGTLPPLGPNFIAMGRFGNVMLVGGETEFLGEANPGEVVRLYLVNAANTRIFDFMAESRKWYWTYRAQDYRIRAPQSCRWGRGKCIQEKGRESGMNKDCPEPRFVQSAEKQLCCGAWEVKIFTSAPDPKLVCGCQI